MLRCLKSMLGVLVGTNRGKDVSDLPKRNKHILGVTSLWMLMPIAHGMLQWCYRDIELGQKAAIAALTCSCFSSVMFWRDARQGSLFHRLDKLCAVQYIVCTVPLAAVPAINRWGLKCMVLPCLLLVLFLLGDACFRRNWYELQLSLHLLFRYAAYWLGHVLLVPVEQSFAAAFVILSTAYVGHILVFDCVAQSRVLSDATGTYWGSCAVLAFWVLITAQLHACVSYA